jgi:hypothetical protein
MLGTSTNPPTTIRSKRRIQQRGKRERERESRRRRRKRKRNRNRKRKEREGPFQERNASSPFTQGTSRKRQVQYRNQLIDRLPVSIRSISGHEGMKCPGGEQRDILLSSVALLIHDCNQSSPEVAEPNPIQDGT